MSIRYEFVSSPQESNVYIEGCIDEKLSIEVLMRDDVIKILFYHDNIVSSINVDEMTNFLNFARNELGPEKS